LLTHSDSEELRHAYDPVKAREYYLRTRELKGRKPGKGKEVGSRPSPKGVVRSNRADKASKTTAQKRTEQAARVKALKGKLDRLQDLLKQLTEKVNKKSRSGDDAKSSSDKSSSSSKSGGGSKDSKDRKPLTAKQKADARKRAKESYEKSKPNPEDTSTAKDYEQKIADVREQIRKIQQQLREARSQTSSNKTAPKGR
jgi:chromosome segregation ATPase